MPAVAHAVTAPWSATLNGSERSLIYYFLVIAGLALLAMLIRTWVSRNEIGSRFRPAIFASLGVVGVAFVSYVVLVLKFDLGYTLTGGMWTPNKDAIWSWAPRYMDWSITVPLLMVELIAVSALTGLMAKRMRTIGIAFAFLMIFLGYLGGVVIDDGTSLAALWTYGILSGLCMVVLYFVVIITVVRSLPHLPAAARPAYRNAMILLLVVWFAYPIVFGFQGFTHGGGWTLTEQLILCVADIVAKVGFGSLIHKVAKLRTAEDVESGIEVHPESIWVDETKQADAVNAPFRATTGEAPARAGQSLR